MNGSSVTRSSGFVGGRWRAGGDAVGVVDAEEFRGRWSYGGGRVVIGDLSGGRLRSGMVWVVMVDGAEGGCSCRALWCW